MNALRTETTIRENGTLTLEGLPFEVGDAVEVIIMETAPRPESTDTDPLRGMVRHYDAPFEPVSEQEWCALA